jgi:CRP-like cAMP-binding protein
MIEATSLNAHDLVGQVPYFAGLDTAALRDVSHKVRRRAVDPREQILVEGEPCSGLYVVLRGHVRLVKTSADGREHVLRVLGPGTTFNDAAVFDGGANSDSAVADGPAIIGVIPRAEMDVLVKRHPGIATAALKLLSGRQRALGTAIENLALRDVTTRVARLIYGCHKQHDHVVEGAPNACARITHQDIAAMVCSVREVVQRALKDQEQSGAIRLERSRIHVCDAAKLHAHCEPDND